ncbi:MAG: DUF134 domain-containing protein [Candidatus Heimdallarchaeota archaeon]
MRYYHFRCEKKRKRFCEERECPKGQRRGRPLKEIVIYELPKIRRVVPKPKISEEPIRLTIAEYEALRLVDLLGLTQEEAGRKMALSKTALWRLINSARRKMAEMLVEGKELYFSEQIEK